MTVNIHKCGNSQGQSKTEKPSVNDSRIIIEKAACTRKNIKELFEDCDSSYVLKEINWDKAEGKEIW